MAALTPFNCVLLRPRGALARAPEQKLALEGALRTINVWYVHARTITLILSSHGYRKSGWAAFERHLASMASKQSDLLALRQIGSTHRPLVYGFSTLRRLPAR